MSKEMFYCERCGKEIIFRCGYSKIDHKLICVDCGNKEEPKELAKKITDLKAKLAESEKEIASLEVCLLENKNNMKEMQEFKIGEDEYDLTDEDARNDLRDYIQEFEKVSKRVYEQKEYAEKILRMSTSEEHQEILQLKQQLEEKEKEYKFKLKEMDNEYKKEFKTFEEDCKHLYKTETKKAIYELKKVKELININGYGDNQGNVSWSSIEEIIDQQIKELKGEK